MTTGGALTLLVVVTTVTVADNSRQAVLYPKHKSGGLVCYSDRRADGGAFWTYADEKQRRPYIFHCPSSLSAWCVNVATGPLSVRGCSGPTGINKAGCFHVIDTEQNATSKVCLCNRDYCNDAVAETTTPSLLLALVVTTAAANYGRLSSMIAR